jgi:predicted N-acetyltransferase YhbS
MPWWKEWADAMPSLSDASFRGLREDDAPGIARLLGQFGYPTDPEALARRLGRIGADPATHVLVAEEGGMVVGVGAVHFIDILEGDRPLTALIALVVDEGHQRRGIGTALVQALEREAEVRGSFGIAVHSGKQRIGAHAFYRGLGYALTGERMLKLFPAALEH